MRIETTNRDVSVSGGLIRLMLLMVIGCYACGKDCKSKITIYQGLYFQRGQRFELSIDDQIILADKFKADVQRNEPKQIEVYCCTKDSCKVKFGLGSSDTIFYMSPSRTKRLMVGSDIYGKFSVATDVDKRAWIKM
jgi:hypothetical protein